MSTRGSSIRHYGRGLELVAYDERYAIYTNPRDCDFLETIRRDKKKITKRDRIEIQALKDFLLTPTDLTAH